MPTSLCLAFHCCQYAGDQVECLLCAMLIRDNCQMCFLHACKASTGQHTRMLGETHSCPDAPTVNKESSYIACVVACANKRTCYKDRWGRASLLKNPCPDAVGTPDHVAYCGQIRMHVVVATLVLFHVHIFLATFHCGQKAGHQVECLLGATYSQSASNL